MPEDLGLRVEVAEERSPADSGRAGDVLDGGFVEAALGEQPEGDELEFAGAGAGRPAATTRRLEGCFWHAVTIPFPPFVTACQFGGAMSNDPTPSNPEPQ